MPRPNTIADSPKRKGARSWAVERDAEHLEEHGALVGDLGADPYDGGRGLAGVGRVVALVHHAFPDRDGRDPVAHGHDVGHRAVTRVVRVAGPVPLDLEPAVCPAEDRELGARRDQPEPVAQQHLAAAQLLRELVGRDFTRVGRAEHQRFGVHLRNLISPKPISPRPTPRAQHEGVRAVTACRGR